MTSLDLSGIPTCRYFPKYKGKRKPKCGCLPCQIIYHIVKMGGHEVICKPKNKEKP